MTEPTDDPFSTDATRDSDGDVVQSFALTVTAGPDTGRRHTSAGSVTVGTHESAGLTLTDSTVSRFHCEISVSGGRARVRDLGSLNGTSVDGVSVVEAFLTDGVALVIGRTRLRFDIAPDRVALPTSEQNRFGTLIGRSVAMRRVFAVLKHAAASDATVLIGGETGTGKEAAAESLHRESARASGPFMVIDCASVPHHLLESELFGHEKGAFTGAVASREGIFEAANGGTVFLDEIGELGPELQPKLLRVLERREVKRVGSNDRVSVDVRLVAATNRDLRGEVNARRFRSDLYYRLAVIEVQLPPLRARKEDLPLLVAHFLASMNATETPAGRVVMSPSFVDELGQHAWPGNVRELRNYIERAVALHDLAPEAHEPVTAAVRADARGLDRPLKEAREEWVSRFERAYLEAALERHGGNVTAAARAAGVDRVHFYRLLWRHKLR